MERKIETSTVFSRIRKASQNSRIIVNEGSSRSTKTYSILQFIILNCLERKRKITISRLKLTWLKTTVIPDFIDVMTTQFGIFDLDRWNKSDSKYVFENGSEINFIGLDEAQKMHGMKQDIAWLNEAVECGHKDFEQIIIRTTEFIILDYNPSYEQHWIYDKVLPRNDCTLIHSTYLDNPFLNQSIIDEIERLEPTETNIEQGTADEVSWKIYGLGERAAHRGLIFSKVKVCDDFPPEDEWSRVFYGLDFGYTNDPSCLAKIVYSQGNLYAKEMFYKRGLTNIINSKNPSQSSIEQHLIDLEVPYGARIWCDAAEPKSIDDLYNCGWGNIAPADKGPDSVIAGIDTILRFNFFVTSDSVNAIKEKNNYKWKEDRKTGQALNEPIDNWNHFWDAVRYGVYMEMRRHDVSTDLISGHGSGTIYE